MPLAFVIVRYFAYAFFAVAVAWLLAFMALSTAINTGIVYEASWGPANVREVAARLADKKDLGAADIPTAYHYLVVDVSGIVRNTDLEGTRLESATTAALAVLAAEPRLQEGVNTSLDVFPMRYHSIGSWHLALYNFLLKAF